VNDRLRARLPQVDRDKQRICEQLRIVQQQLERLRQFILGGDTSSKVRIWLQEAEQEEERLKAALGRLDTDGRVPQLRVDPGRVIPYLEDLRSTLGKGGPRARQLLRGDVQQVNVHPVLDAVKPFARAEVISTGKGLLDRVAFVVAGAGYAECYTASETYWIDLK
jgi:hypothetical protein